VRLVFIDAGPLVSVWWYIEVGPTESRKSIGMPGGNDKTTKGETLGLDKQQCVPHWRHEQETEGANDDHYIC
jgi:hypothetical protein